MTFFSGYILLRYLWTTKVFSSYPWLQSLLTDKRDDLVLVALLWVILWWRLGHVVLYELSYYLSHPGEILQIWQWWMSFIWWVIWVVTWLFYLTKKLDLSKNELFLLGDIILCIVPLGSFLWRIGNGLNQELYGLPIDVLPEKIWWFIENIWLVRVYDSIDMQARVDTNTLQSTTEWAFILLFTWWILFGRYLKWLIRPWFITWVFFMLYGIFRFFSEFLKDLPAYEMRWALSVSQWIMFVFISVWYRFIWQSQKDYLPNSK